MSTLPCNEHYYSNLEFNKSIDLDYTVSGTTATIEVPNRAYSVNQVYAPLDCVEALKGCTTADSLESICNGKEFFKYSTNTRNMCSGAKITGAPLDAPNSTDTSFMYHGCSGLTGAPVIASRSTNTASMYEGCSKITGAPAVSSISTNTYNMYRNCSSMTGKPLVSSKSTNTVGMYENCSKISGPPVFSTLSPNASYMYRGCSSMTGSPTIIVQQTDVSHLYDGCTGLKGTPSFSMASSVKGDYLFSNIPSLTGTWDWNTYNNFSSVKGMFYGRSTSSDWLNIYVSAGSTTDKKLWNGGTCPCLSSDLKWTSHPCGYRNDSYHINIINCYQPRWDLMILAKSAKGPERITYKTEWGYELPNPYPDPPYWDNSIGQYYFSSFSLNIKCDPLGCDISKIKFPQYVYIDQRYVDDLIYCSKYSDMKMGSIPADAYYDTRYGVHFYETGKADHAYDCKNIHFGY